MKQIFKAAFLPVLISIFTAGCISMSIPEQKDPSLSMMVFKLNIPKEFNIISVEIESEANKSYSQTMMRTKKTSDNKELNSFINIPSGKYRLKRLYAKTDRVGNSYRELSLDFKNTANRTTGADNWMELKAGSIQYAGFLEFVTIEKKDQVIASLATAFKKTPQEIEKAIINESELKTSSKIKTNCIIIRLDHPAIIGEIDSLKIEKEVWQILLKKERRDPATKWDKLINDRIGEIDKVLLKQQKKGKK